jgi:glycosyltransferase involved in cell wall biosynthesis
VFAGQLSGSELAQALASADIFLNPSITETFGNVTLEAMACALPVVAAAASGATSLVRNGKTGILVEPGAIDEFAAALYKYAAKPALRARHGAAGLAYAKTMDWDSINAAVMKVYARVIERRRRAKAMGVTI